MRNREVATRSFDGTGDLVVVAPLKDDFIDAYDSVTYETRARMAAEALHNIRLNAREYEAVLPYSDTTERILNVLDFRLGFIDKNLFDLGGADSGTGDATLPHRLRARRFLFLSVTFDSGWEPYMRLIWKPLGAFLDLFFCNCEGYPPAGDTGFDDYIAWVRSAQVESSIFYSATGLSVADMLWFKQADRIATDPARTATQASDLAELVVKPPVESAAIFRQRPENLFKSVQVGMEALNVLYKLGELYPAQRHRADSTAPPEGRHLLRATHELLNGFDAVLAQLHQQAPAAATMLRRIYAEPLAWWDNGKQLLANHGPQSAEPALDRRQIQAGILSPARVEGGIANVGALLLMTITELAKARAFIAALPVSYEDDDRFTDLSLSLAFTPRGLKNLGMDSATLDTWPKEFRDGMELRSGIVGDKHEHHPRNWILPPRGSPLDPDDATGQPGVALGEVDFTLQIRMLTSDASDNAPLIAAIKAIVGGQENGVAIAGWQCMEKGGVLGGDTPRIDHFGFNDDVSQPLPTAGLPPMAADTRYATNEQVRLGELLLGYRNDRGDPPTPPRESIDWQHGSTFLVVRKIEQYPDVLDQWASETCTALNQQHGLTGQPDALTPDALKAYMMGRRLDGSTLVAGADGNNFTYATDPAGRQCPLASHVRRSNPRSEAFGRPTPRLLRRGMSFGPKAANHADGRERGIVFMAYVASIAEQYEVIQRWVNGGNSTGIPAAHSDPLMGVSATGGDRHFQFWHADRLMKCSVPATRIADPLMPHRPAQTSFTRLHWGLYLWVPTKGAIAALAALKPDQIEIVPTDVATGRAIISRIDALPGALKNREWKRLLEDFDSKDPTERGLSPDVWAAIRHDHGGALVVDRHTGAIADQPPRLVLVGDEALATHILSQPQIFSSSAQTARMADHFGLNYVTIDGGEPYWAQSGVTNAIMHAQTADTGFADAYRCAADVLARLLAPARASGLPQTRFDLRRQFLMATLGAMCQHWFSLPGSDFMALGGLDFDPTRTKARCPGDFISSSRYIFNPEPSAELTAIGQHHGKLIRQASRDYVAHFRGQPAGPGGTLTPLLFEAIPDDDLLARNLSGMMLGMLAPIEANLRGILLEWLSEQSLWRHQAAYWRACGFRRRPTGTAPDYAAARGALGQAILTAMSIRPAPDALYRTVAQEHSMAVPGGAAVLFKQDDLVIVSLASITQHRLHMGQPDASFIFGGRRNANDRCPFHVGAHEWPNVDQRADLPLHACPARQLMTGAITGIMAALFDAGRIQAMPAGMVIGIDTVP